MGDFFVEKKGVTGKGKIRISRAELKEYAAVKKRKQCKNNVKYI